MRSSGAKIAPECTKVKDENGKNHSVGISLSALGDSFSACLLGIEQSSSLSSNIESFLLSDAVQSVKDPAVKLSQRKNNFVGTGERVPVNVDTQTTIRNALSGISQRSKRRKKAKDKQSSKKIGNTVSAGEAAAAASSSADDYGDGDGDDDNEEHELPWFVPRQYTITLPSGQQRSYALNSIQRMFVMITDSSSW
jgi:hypothetical protein